MELEYTTAMQSPLNSLSVVNNCWRKKFKNSKINVYVSTYPKIENGTREEGPMSL